MPPYCTTSDSTPPTGIRSGGVITNLPCWWVNFTALVPLTSTFETVSAWERSSANRGRTAVVTAMIVARPVSRLLDTL